MAPPLPEPAQPATPTARTIIVIIAILIGTSCFGRGGERGQCGGTPGTRNVRVNLEIDFRILLRLIRFCADLQRTTVRTGLVTLPSEERDNLVAPGRTLSPIFRRLPLARQFRHSQRYSGLNGALELAKHGDVFDDDAVDRVVGEIAEGCSRDRIFLSAC